LRVLAQIQYQSNIKYVYALLTPIYSHKNKQTKYI